MSLEHKLATLKEDLNYKVKRRHELIADDDGNPRDSWSAEERSEHEQLTKDIADMKVAIEKAQDQLDNFNESKRAIDEMTKPQPITGIVGDGKALSEPIQRNDIAAGPKIESVRYGKLRSFSQTFPTLREQERAAHKSGLCIRAVCFRDKKAQRQLRETYGIDYRALSEGVNTAGGFLVPEEMSSTIIDLRETYGIFRQNVRIVPMGSDSMQIPRRSGGLTANFTGENAAITESDKSWNQVTLTAKKSAVLTRMSSELAEDAIINLADDIAGEIAYAFAEQEDTVGFTGNGTAAHGSIKGVQTLLEDNEATFAGTPDATSGTDTAIEISATDIATLMATLPQYAHNGAKFYCSMYMFDACFGRLGIAGGGNTMGDQAQPTPPRWNGHDIVISQKLRGSGTINNQVLLMFGRLDLAASMGDRRGVEIAISNDRYFENDQVALKGTVRYDINVHDIGDATSAGPIVGLIGNT